MEISGPLDRPLKLRFAEKEVFYFLREAKFQQPVFMARQYLI
jgi:hypothetical protein